MVVSKISFPAFSAISISSAQNLTYKKPQLFIPSISIQSLKATNPTHIDIKQSIWVFGSGFSLTRHDIRENHKWQPCLTSNKDKIKLNKWRYQSTSKCRILNIFNHHQDSYYLINHYQFTRIITRWFRHINSRKTLHCKICYQTFFFQMNKVMKS